MKILRILLLPFSLIYWAVTSLRNLFYDLGLFKTESFDMPVISVGNLKVGGTGKTPHIEYLVRLLTNNDFQCATLSRGYGRLTTGFQQAGEETTVYEIGDEPYQVYQKFKNIKVAVDEARVRGIQKLINQNPDLKAILLDDAFQHRKVTPGINILLTEYNDPYKNDYPMPTGNLREWRSGANRADIIIVTKTPEIFSPLERRILMQEINPKPYQHVYFTYMKYGSFIPLRPAGEKKQMMAKEYYFSRDFACLLVTGIASSGNLKYYLEQHLADVKHLSFKDHYRYKKTDLEKIKGIFEGIENKNKFIVTTEKDAGRLMTEGLHELTQDLPIFYLEIEAEFQDKDKESFNEQILTYVGRN